MAVPDMNVLARIGCLDVQLTGSLPAGLARLERDGCAADARADCSVHVECCAARAWELPGDSVTSGPNGVVRSLPGHRMTACWRRRHVALRVVETLAAPDVAMLRRDLFCALAALSGEVLVHASAVVHDGRGFVFCGPSGSGKSTIARLLAGGGARVVNDEINWIVLDGADATPRLVDQGYWLDDPATVPVPRVPLAGIFLLGHAEACRCEPVTTEAAFPVLLAAPYGGADPMLGQRANATARMLARQPATRLWFSRDRHAVERVLWGA